jgi:fibronectin type 3 domain-containing protein
MAPPPAPPTAVTAPAGKRKVTLKWTQSSSAGVTNYRIYRSTADGGPYTAVATINAGASYANTALTAGKTYYYVVTSLLGNGLESVFSIQASGKPY